MGLPSSFSGVVPEFCGMYTELSHRAYGTQTGDILASNVVHPSRCLLMISILPLGLWLRIHVGSTGLAPCRPRSVLLTSITHPGARGLFCSWLGKLALSVCPLVPPARSSHLGRALVEPPHRTPSDSSDLPQASLPC